MAISWGYNQYINRLKERGIYDRADIVSGILRALCTEASLTEETLRVYGRGIKVHWTHTTDVDTHTNHFFFYVWYKELKRI